MKKSLIINVSLVLLAAVVAVFLSYLILAPADTWRERFTALAAETTGRDVTCGAVKFTLFGGLRWSFFDVSVMEEDGKTVFATIDEVELSVAPLSLMMGKVVLSSVRLVGPRVVVRRDGNGRWNVTDIFTPKGGWTVRIEMLSVRGGRVECRDALKRRDEHVVRWENLHGAAFRLGRLEYTQLSFKGDIVYRDERGALELQGNFRLPTGGGALLPGLFLDIRMELAAVPVRSLTPYGGVFLQTAGLAGLIDGSFTVTMKGDETVSAGNLSLRNGEFRAPHIFDAPLRPRTFRLSYEMTKMPDKLHIRDLQGEMDVLRLSGDMVLQGLGGNNPYLDLRFRSAPFLFEGCAAYIPHGLLPESVSRYIKDHIHGGIFRIDEARIAGRINEIRRMGKDETSVILEAKGAVEEGVVTYGPAHPIFRHVKGELLIQGSDFLLKDMRGCFGDSPFVLDGAVRGYRLSAPSTISFTAVVAPAPSEVAWLLGKEKGLLYEGDSHLKLTGNGTLGDYHLEGKWDLRRSHLRWASFVKPLDGEAKLSFAMSFGERGAHVKKIHCDLGRISFSGSAFVPYGGDVSASLHFPTFPLEEIPVYFPEVGFYKPRGEVQLTMEVGGEGEGRSWRVEAAVGDGKLETGWEGVSLTDIRGVVQLNAAGLVTEGLNLRVGESRLTVRGRMGGIGKPELDLEFSASHFYPDDFGWRSGATVPVVLRDFFGRLEMTPVKRTLTVRSARLNDSVLEGDLNFTGDGKTIVCRLKCPVLNVDDLLLLARLEKKTAAGKGETMNVRGLIEARRGFLGPAAYEDLRAHINFLPEILKIDAFSFRLAGGVVWGEGSASLPLGGAPRGEFQINLQRVPIETMTAMTHLDQELLRGSLTARGSFAAVGPGLLSIKRSFRGNLEVRVEKGVLRKFPVLSKMFSILNVSQIFKFRLPDMAAEGMPFDFIMGNFTVSDGVIETRDLVLMGGAMNIIAVGKADMVGESLDAKIAVQPLQTVDLLLGRLPVIGWILADHDRRVVAVHFTARGPWKNPDVTAMPIRDLGREILEIIKRILKLPMKLFTDTGEVF